MLHRTEVVSIKTSIWKVKNREIHPKTKMGSQRTLHNQNNLEIEEQSLVLLLSSKASHKFAVIQSVVFT